MKEHKFVEIEDFLIDPIFQQYCGEENDLSIQYWENYLKNNPHQAETIDRAKRLYQILSANRRPIQKQLHQFKQTVTDKTTYQKPTPIINYWKWASIAVVLLAVLSVGYYFLNLEKDGTVSTAVVFSQQNLSTKKGEKKEFTLPDGTVVKLNAASQLQLSEDFNQHERRVKLIGEGFFEVQKDAEKPFLVETEDFDIKVLGTVFNVKTYPEASESEAFLLEGLIEMHSKGKNGNAILIRPNQRVSIQRSSKLIPMEEQKLSSPKQQGAKEIVIHELVEDLAAEEINDIAWKNGRLVMADQDFEEVKYMLERWYDVEIELAGEKIKDYRFTATFSNESIQEALKALQDVQPFNFKIYGKKITISEN